MEVSDHLTRGERDPSTLWIQVCMGPRPGLEILEKRIFSYPCCAKPIIVQPTDQSLHWLCSTGSFKWVHFNLSIQVAFILKHFTTTQNSPAQSLQFFNFGAMVSVLKRLKLQQAAAHTCTITANINLPGRYACSLVWCLSAHESGSPVDSGGHAIERSPRTAVPAGGSIHSSSPAWS